MANEWYLRSGGAVTGPILSDQLKAMGNAGRITTAMEVATASVGPWHAASSVKGLTVIPAATTPASATTVAVVGPEHVTTEKTSKTIKGQQMFARLVFVISVIVCVVSASQSDGEQISPAAMIASVAAVGCVCWLTALRFSTWWHHG
jgi:mannose/fructose/N-acetylgalactosamine-specific phosphotransferase system component IID